MSGANRDGWVVEDDILYLPARPLPSGSSNPGLTECSVTSDWQETRDLIVALLANDLEGFQVRIDLRALTDGYEDVCLNRDRLSEDDYEEAKAAARYIKRAAERLEAWAEAHAPSRPSSPGSRT